MAFGFSKARFSPIAVDFGVDSVKLLQIIPGDPPQMVAAAAVPLPEHARTDPATRYGVITEALKQLLHTQPFKGRRAIVSLPAFQTLTQHLQVTRGDPAEIEGQIAVHLRERLNLDPARLVIRHFPVAQVMRDGAARQEIICLAASREAVMRHVEAARRAKLDVVGMHCEPVAILAAFAHLYRRAGDEKRTIAFIDIGAASTKVVIAHGKEMVFSKTIHAAGDHLTRQLAQAKGLSFEEARKLRMLEVETAGVPEPTEPAPGELVVQATPTKHSGSGLAVLEAPTATATASGDDRRGSPALAAPPAPPAHAPGGGGTGGGNGSHAPDAQDSDVIECLIDELKMCLRYHQNIFPDRAMEKLVFLGGESRHVAACQRIARTLRIGAQLGDPLARLIRVNHARPPAGVDLRQQQPGWAVPMGLCLCEANL